MKIDSFDEVLKQVPGTQKSVLDRMVGLRLVESFGWNQGAHKCHVKFTERGADFVALFQTVVGPDPGERRASLIALDLVARGEIVAGGYAAEDAP